MRLGHRRRRRPQVVLGAGPDFVRICRRNAELALALATKIARMPMLAVPYVPNWAEFLALSNRRILADQMDFLKSQFNRKNRILGIA